MHDYYDDALKQVNQNKGSTASMHDGCFERCRPWGLESVDHLLPKPDGASWSPLLPIQWDPLSLRSVLTPSSSPQNRSCRHVSTLTVISILIRPSHLTSSLKCNVLNQTPKHKVLQQVFPASRTTPPSTTRFLRAQITQSFQLKLVFSYSERQLRCPRIFPSSH